MNIRAKIGIAAVAILFVFSVVMLFKAPDDGDSVEDCAPPTVFARASDIGAALT